MQSAGNHQVEHQPEVTLEADGDALANAAQFAGDAAFGADQRRVDGSQQEN